MMGGILAKSDLFFDQHYMITTDVEANSITTLSIAYLPLPSICTFTLKLG